jgi:hypothetical protein
MSEELEQNNDGTFSGLKKTVIGVITTAVMGLGTWGVTQITGGGDEPAPVQAAPVINITNSNQQSQQQSAAAGKTVIIKEKAAPAQQAAPAPAPKKKEGDEFKEKPAQW